MRPLLKIFDRAIKVNKILNNAIIKSDIKDNQRERTAVHFNKCSQ